MMFLGLWAAGLGVAISFFTPATSSMMFLGLWAAGLGVAISFLTPLTSVRSFLGDPGLVMGDTSISTGREGVETESKSKLVTSRFRGESDTEWSDWERKALLGDPRK